MAKVLAAVLSIFVSLAFGVPQGSSSQGIVGRVRGANGAPVTGERGGPEQREVTLLGAETRAHAIAPDTRHAISR